MTTAIVLLDVERTVMSTIGPEIAAVEGVDESYSVSGEWDFVAIVRIDESSSLASVVSDQLGGLNGVIRTHTMVAFERFGEGSQD
jgi:DNA-binding Lrp family transcriptional regulator